MFRKLGLKQRLLAQFLAVGLLPVLFIGAMAYYAGSSALEEAAVQQLEMVNHIKSNAVIRYFESVRDQAVTLADSPSVVEAVKTFRSEFSSAAATQSAQAISAMRSELAKYYEGSFGAEYKKQNGKDIDARSKLQMLDPAGVVLQYQYIQNNSHPLGSKHRLDYAEDGSTYSMAHKSFHPVTRAFLERFGYYDIFLIDHETGHVVYSVFKELDFASSLMTGPYADSNLAAVFKKAAASTVKGESFFADFQTYVPSYDAPASFIAVPVFDGDSKVGVLAFQMPLDRVSMVMKERTGMGETGESLLVGPDHLLRSDSHVAKDEYTVVNSFRNPEKYKIKDDAVTTALSGKDGVFEEKSYLGHDVIAASDPIDILGVKWAIVSEIHVDEALAPVVKLKYWMVGVTTVLLILVAVFAAFTGRSISRPIMHVAEELEKNSVYVAGSAENLSATGSQLSESVAEQASSLQETAASIEEISAMVKNNVEQAEHSAVLSDEVRQTADKGNTTMRSLVTSMGEITESNKEIQDLVRVIGEIGEKTEVIDEIVFQTKLLSFNASVEAERAGEHGRGFAVVAQEVGNLAQMSGKAALEIAAMVKSSIKTAEAITSENRKKVENGSSLVSEVAKHLAEIASKAELLARQSQQITTASREQSEGIGQINEAMSQLDQATQQNSAAAQDTASNSEELRAQAQNLKDNVAHLVGLVQGAGQTATSPGSMSTSKVSTPAVQAKILPFESRSSAAPRSPASQAQIKSAAGDGFVTGNADDNWEKL